MLREHAYDSLTVRQLYSLELASVSGLPRLQLQAEHFACLLAWDARGFSKEIVSSIVDPLLRAGAAYFICWGPDCERVHDIVDELVWNPQNNFRVPEDSSVMTTWHDSESLQGALWFFLVLSLPDEYYQSSTGAGLAVSIGSPQWAVEIANALDHPADFVRFASGGD